MKNQKDIDRRTTFPPLSFALTSHQFFNVGKHQKVGKMEASLMGKKKLCAMRGLASLVLLTLASCSSGTPVAQDVHPGDGNAAQRPVRVIISFQKPTSDNPQLSAAIAEACRCTPVFIRPYLNTALIYQVALPQGQPFSTFERALLAKGAALGVRGVEQDSLEHIYAPR
jgi:hypothetical protein